MLDAAPRCTCCHSLLYADELGMYACRPCIARIDRDLMMLAGPRGLYARLGGQLEPGSGSDGPAVSGSRSAAAPVRLEALSLIANGGVISTLESWVEDWATYGLAQICEGGRLQHRLDRAVATLRLNLQRAAGRHVAIDEFAAEIARVRRQCEAQLGGEKPPRRVTVACPCGGTMRVTLDTPGARCGGCETQYGHAEVLQLPMAERSVAA